MRPLALLLLALGVSIAALAQQHFDFKVREDMFAGMDGDTVAFGRAMKLIAEGLKLSAEGIGDMERAVSLAPNDIAVRVSRGAGLQPYARGLRPFDRAGADKLTAIAIGDFEFVVATSLPYWSKLSEHGRGELLGALADGWSSLGEPAKVNADLDRMSRELPGSAYARNAALRRADPSARVPLTCLGCH